MVFLQTIKNSIYSPEFYQGLKERRPRSSFAYFFKLAILLSFIGTVFFSVILMPPLSRFLSTENLNALVNLYPEDLTLTVKNETVSTNGAEPRFVDFPGIPLPTGKTHFIVIDTRAPVKLDNFAAYQSVVWIAQNAVVIENSTKTTVQYLKGIPDLVLNRDSIRSRLGSFRPLIKLAPFLLICGIFMILVVSHLFKLVYLLIFALLVMLIGKIQKIPLTYAESYRFAIHLITLPLLIDLSLVLIPGFTRGVPFLFTAIGVVTAFFNLKRFPNVTLLAPTEPPPPQV